MAMWVFGYGSLLWKPGFDVAESVIGRLPGYARSFCMRSIHHRGTPEAPGRVATLIRSPGAVCHGMAYRITPEVLAPLDVYWQTAFRQSPISAYCCWKLEAKMIISGSISL